MKKHKYLPTEKGINRTTTAAVLLAGLLPLLTLAFVQSDERSEIERSLKVAVVDVTQEYQRMRSLPTLQRSYAAEAASATKNIIPIMREKRLLRKKVSFLNTIILNHEWFSAVNGDSFVARSGQQSQALLLIRGIQKTSSVLRGAVHDGPSLSKLVSAAAQEFLMNNSNLHASAPDDEDVQIASYVSQLSDARARLNVMNREAEKALEIEREAVQKLGNINDQMERIQKTTEEVHADVIRMQGQLARIDAQIRSRIERELIQKGLLTPGTIDHSAIPDQPQFAWPAYGSVSAGFLDPDYKEHFGIEHYGIDIVIGQGSPVFAAADGIVFLARDGGATGYSYVLIGHRGGSATLYGHLSQISVSTGQDIRQGAAVGLSGGAVGVHGSGPTTTGPHLHFEVLQNGTNIDPKGALP